MEDDLHGQGARGCAQCFAGGRNVWNWQRLLRKVEKDSTIRIASGVHAVI